MPIDTRILQAPRDSFRVVFHHRLTSDIPPIVVADTSTLEAALRTRELEQRKRTETGDRGYCSIFNPAAECIA
ncbi:hypothetical protein ISS03_04290 [Patescibacteria group bacterium]|nr:hypothetical protein [Patescibacteria group bacterium]